MTPLCDPSLLKSSCHVAGRRHALGGTFYEPTILADLTPVMRLAREEVFGPVAPLFRFTDESKAIALANDTGYGLAGDLYARDLGRIWRVGEALDYDMVGINLAAHFRPPAIPTSATIGACLPPGTRGAPSRSIHIKLTREVRGSHGIRYHEVCIRL